MKYDFECKECDNIVEIECKPEDITKHVNCEICEKEMDRVWGVPMIKTNDGTKI